jgi:hypothetical protein
MRLAVQAVTHRSMRDEPWGVCCCEVTGEFDCAALCRTLAATMMHKREFHESAIVEGFPFLMRKLGMRTCARRAVSLPTKKTVAMRRGMEGMAGFDQVLVDSGLDPSDFLASMQAEVAGGFKLSAIPRNVHTLRSLIVPGIVRAGLVSDRVRPT